MSDGKVFLAIGLALDVVGTLFISVDAYRGQKQTTAMYGLLGFIFGFEAMQLRTKRGDEKTNKLVAEAASRVPPGARGQVAAAAAELAEYQDIVEMLPDAEDQATARNKASIQTKLNELSDEFASRKYFIFAAIAAVFVGGIFEFVGGVLL